MPDATVSPTLDNVSGTTEPPPITMFLPMLRTILAGSSLLPRFGLRLLLTAVYPLHVIWSVMRALFSPIIILVEVILEIMLFTPFSIISTIAIALYPVYVFCAVACIFGAIIGIFGHYVSTAILGVLARSKYFIPSRDTPPAAPSSGPQVTLRKRKRKSVRLQ